MNNERITLTMKEQRTNDIMVKLISKEISMNDAIRLTGLSERQLYRKKKGYLKNSFNHLESIPDPGKFIYAGDAIHQTSKKPQVNFGISLSATSFLGLVHTKRANILYLDGHVATQGKEKPAGFPFSFTTVDYP